MDDAFLRRIDNAIGNQASVDCDKRHMLAGNSQFIRSKLPTLVAIANEYAQMCRNKGIEAEVEHGDDWVLFGLCYKDGRNLYFVASSDGEAAGHLSFVKHYPDVNGKRLRSLPTGQYDKSTWSDQIFIDHVQMTIDEFLNSAN